MSAPTYVYQVGLEEQFRPIVVRQIASLLQGPYGLSKRARIILTKDLHLYVIDDDYLQAPKTGAVSSTSSLKSEKSFVQSHATDLIGDLGGALAKSTGSNSVSLWSLTSQRFERTAQAKVTWQAEPHHWFVAYEITLPTPDGQVRGVMGSVLEIRFVETAKNRLMLMGLSLRFPLYGKRISTYWPGAPLPEVEISPSPTNESPPATVSPAAIEAPQAFPVFAPFSLPQKPLTPATSLANPGQVHQPTPSSNGSAADAATATNTSSSPVFVLPTSGSTLLAPYAYYGEDDDGRITPATPDSAMLIVEQLTNENGLTLNTWVEPRTYADWEYTWFYAGLTNRDGTTATAVVQGQTLNLDSGLYDVDVTATRNYGAEGSGLAIPVVLRSRRQFSSSHATFTLQLKESDSPEASLS